MPQLTHGRSSAHDSVRDREIGVEQEHLDRVYRRLEEKIHEAEFLMNDAAKRGQVGTPGALAERDAQVFRAGIHLNRLNNEFEDFLFGRIDLLPGKDGKKGPDGAYTAVEPAEGAIRADNTADIAETLHIGRIGVLDSDYAPLVIDWRAPAAAPFYRSTPVDPGRVVRRRVIRSKGRRVLGVEDDLMRPELTASLDGDELPVIGDGALMAALGQARSHTMRDIVASIQAEQDLVIRAPAASVTVRRGRPRHRQDGRRPAPRRVPALPGPAPVRGRHPDRLARPRCSSRTPRACCRPSARRARSPSARSAPSSTAREATLYDSPAVARAKGSSRMLKVLRKAARGALELPGRPRAADGQLAFGDATPTAGAGRPPARPPGCGSSPSAAGSSWRPTSCDRIRHNVLGGTAPVNLLRPRARRLLLDALWAKSGAGTAGTRDPELAAELRSSFDEDVTTEDAFIALPGRLVARADPARRAGRDGRRAAARPLGPPDPQPAARSRRRRPLPEAATGLSVHDVALLDELQALLGTPARPSRKRELDPLDQLTGLEELMPRPRGDAARAGRAAGGRSAPSTRTSSSTRRRTSRPMQWRMVGRRGRHATWTVVGDPAQSSWSDPDEAAEARDEALGTRPRRRFTLTVNYRNPAEIAELAAKVLALAMPGSESPSAVRSTGVRAALRAVVRDGDLAADRPRGGRAAAGPGRRHGRRRRRHEPPRGGRRWLAGLGDRVVALGSLEAKGLEYDATVVVSPGGDRRRVPGRAAGAVRGADPGDPAAHGVSADRDEPDADGVPDLLRD